MKRNLLLSMMFALAGGLFSTSAWAQNWSGSTVGDAKDKTVYLWNVGAKKFLGKGRRWGTEAVISNVGTPFTLKTSDSKFYLVSLAKAEGGSSNGCLEFMNGVNSTHDAGNFFVDRNYSAGTSTQLYSYTGSQTAYQFQVTSNSSKGSSGEYKGTFYLVADPTTGKAKGETSIASGSEDYSKWIVVTLDERKEYFKKAEASESSTVPATFLMDDQDFARKDLSVSSWQTMSSSSATSFDGTLSNSSEYKLPSYAYTSVIPKFYTHTYSGTCTESGSWYSHTVTYKVTNTIAGDLQKENTPELTIGCGGYSKWNISHKSTDVTVTYVSTVETENEGYTYYVGNGYGEANTTDTDEDGNKLDETSNEQEIYGGEWTANIHGSYGVVNQTIPNANMIREGWYKVSCVGFTTATTGTAQLYASAGTTSEVGDEYNVQPLTKIASDSRPTTYVKASQLINGNGGKYESSVMVYVGTKSDNTLKTLSFGIQVDGADASDWTCFDNFQVEYLGMPTQELVLDEEQAAVDYINKQTSTELNQKKTLYLHRTLNANKWNSIVLPVDLTVGQVQSAFGDATKLSEFKGATNKDMPGRMYFEAVQVDRDNKNATAIKAGTLYIMKPTKEEPTDQKDVEFPTETGVDKTLNSYFTIVGVNKDNTDVEASVKGEVGDETFEGPRDVQFVGTYVAGDKLIPANSYVLRGNHDAEAGLWFYRTVETNTKGFRGWLQVLNPANAAKISFSINGIIDEGEVTAIDGLEMNAASKQDGNIYNLSGQLARSNAATTEGLAKGVYIQNGKKFIVK